MTKEILKSSSDLFKDINENLKHKIKEDNILVDIASIIILYRVKNNLNQEQPAKKLDIPEDMVIKLESGEYRSSIKIFEELKDKFAQFKYEKVKENNKFCWINK
ncbi:helix-turn-helix domain-containing protein [Helcococcus kunzii]